MLKTLNKTKCHWLQHTSQNIVVSVVAKAMRWMPKYCGLISGFKKEIFLFSKASRLAVVANQPPIQRLTGALHPWRHCSQGTAYHSPPTSGEVMNEWCYTSTFRIAFMAITENTLPSVFLAAMHCILLDGKMNGYTDKNMSVKH